MAIWFDLAELARLGDLGLGRLDDGANFAWDDLGGQPGRKVVPPPAWPFISFFQPVAKAADGLEPLGLFGIVL